MNVESETRQLHLSYYVRRTPSGRRSPRNDGGERPLDVGGWSVVYLG
jgi:hypothetical protein